MTAFSPRVIRITLLANIVLSLFFMALQVLRYRPLFAMPGGPALVIEATLMLAAYGGLVVWTTGDRGKFWLDVLQVATPLALFAVAIQLAHLVVERFYDFGARGNGLIAVAAMLCTFAIWAIAGYRAGRVSVRAGAGASAGIWCALVTMAVVVTFGFLLEFYLAPLNLADVTLWPEFKRSGWFDVKAFAIANTLDSGFTHLLAGPVVGALFGGIAGFIGQKQGARRARPDLAV